VQGALRVLALVQALSHLIARSHRVFQLLPLASPVLLLCSKMEYRSVQ